MFIHYVVRIGNCLFAGTTFIAYQAVCYAWQWNSHLYFAVVRAIRDKGITGPVLCIDKETTVFGFPSATFRAMNILRARRTMRLRRLAIPEPLLLEEGY
jgi:hypothetical protein